MPSFGIVLLAAGGSTRMGSPKQLLPYRGRPLLRHATEVALAAECGPVIVVLGSQPDEIALALAGLPVEMVVNPRWEEGMGTSIHAGVEAAQSRGLDGIILGLGDQPLVTAGLLNRLVREHLRTGQPIIASAYAGTVGVPVFFSRKFFPPLMELKPEQGCKGLILKHEDQAILLDCPQAEADIDTPDEYARLASTVPAPPAT